MTVQSTLQTPKGGKAVRGVERRYHGPFNRLKKREQRYKRFAFASAVLLAGVLTVLLLELTGYIQP